MANFDRRAWIGGVLLASRNTEAGHIDGRTRIQKFVYLTQERTEYSSYDFKPSEYGPYSRHLYMDFDELVASGFVEESTEWSDCGQVHYVYSPTKQTLEWCGDLEDESPEESILTQATIVLNQYGDLSLPDLLSELYSEHPMMAKNARPLP